MKKPTIQQIAQYCKERCNRVDAEQFFHFYESKGWKIGKCAMVSWKSCVITWERNTTHSMAIKGRDEDYAKKKATLMAQDKALPNKPVNPEIAELRKEWYPLCNLRGMTVSQRIVAGKKRRELEKQIQVLSDNDSKIGEILK